MIEHHIYDVNFIKAVQNLQEQTNKLGLECKPDGLPLSEYYKRLWQIAEDHYSALDTTSRLKKYSFETLKNVGVLTVQSDCSNFQIAITLDLLTRPKHEIWRFLDYNKQNYVGFGEDATASFENFIEFRVVRNMEKWSPFNEIPNSDEIMRWVVKKNEKPESKPTRRFTEDKGRPKIEKLIDIWEPAKNGKKEEYDSLICKLKEVISPRTESAFVMEEDEKLHWMKIPANGWQQYLAGLIHICMKREWIKKEYSAPTLIKVILATFNVTIHKNPVTNIACNPPKKKYTDPFLSIVPGKREL